MTARDRSRKAWAGGLALQASCIGPQPPMSSRSGVRRLRLVGSIIPISRKAGATTDNTITIPATPQLVIIRKESPAMSQTLHPIEAWILKRRMVRKALLDAFLENKELSVKERMALDLIAIEDETIIEYRAREVAADSYKRNGFTRLTRDRFHDAGAELVDLHDERRKRRSNVVTFPSVGKQQA